MKIHGKTRKSLFPIVAYCEQNQLDIVDFITREYWSSEVSVAELAQKWGVNKYTLLDFMQRRDIPRRSSSEHSRISIAKRHKSWRQIKREGKFLSRTRKSLAPIFNYCEQSNLDIVDFIWSEYGDKEKTLSEMAEEWGVVRQTLADFVDDYKIGRRTRSEVQRLIAKNPSPKQIAQRQRLRKAGLAWLRSPEGREFMRQKMLKSNPMWRPEVSIKVSRANRRTGSYKYNTQFYHLKSLIRARDDYTCQLCGESPSLHVHHIDYDTNNNNVLNLITLCHSCHSKTNGTSERRAKWTEHFRKVQSKRFKVPLEVLRVLKDRRVAYAV